ncbi:MAG: hypothetical protein RLY87_2227 [Chloroflexota bacterium]
MYPTNDVLWNSQPWQSGPSVQQSLRCDVCVVGLGASGLTALMHLHQHGIDAIGIDAGMVGAGAAGSNGGFILAGIAAFHHDAVDELGHTRATRLYHRTLEEIYRLAAEEPTFEHRGSLRIAKDDEEYRDCLRQYAMMRQDGLAVEPYEGSEGRGILVPTDGVFQPLQRVRRLAHALRNAGVTLYERTRVQHIEPHVVVANNHRIACKHIIVAVDGNIEILLPQLVGTLKTTRLQMLATAPDLTLHLPRPVYYNYGYDYWQQRRDGTIAIGGARDQHEASEWGHAAYPTHTVQASIEARLRTTVVSSAPIQQRWGASVAYRLDDVRPFVGQVLPTVWACGGYSGTGNIVGTLCARDIATAIVTGSQHHIAGWHADQ